MNLTFHHIGIGTTKFEAAIKLYENLGYGLTTCVDDENLRVRVAFLANAEAESPLIEILAPLGDKSPLRSLIDRGALPSPYHTCYAVPDIHAAALEFRQKGIIQMTKPAPAVAFSGALVAFFYNAAVGMIELVEQPPPLEHSG